MKRVNRRNIVDAIWMKNKNLERREIDKIVVSLIEEIQNNILAGNLIYLRGIGTIKPKFYSSKKYNNFMGKGLKIIASKIRPVYKPDKFFTDKLDEILKP